MGNSFSLAFPAAKFYIGEIAASITRASRGRGGEFISEYERRNSVLKVPHSWDKAIQWRSERYVAISFVLDASSFHWGAVIHLPTGAISVGVFWEETVGNENINLKEMWAILRGFAVTS